MAVALAAALAGCGGGDDSDLADATNRTCEQVTAAVETLRTALVREPGDDEATAVKAAIDRYAATVREAAEQLAEATPRKQDQAFQAQAVAQLNDHAKQLRAAAGGRDGTARAAAIDRLTAGGAAGVLIPPAVLDGAPACQGAAR